MTEPDEALDRLLRASFAEPAAVAVVRSGRVVAKAATWHDPHALDGQPQFLAWSFSKTLIATLLLQLRDAGALALDDPIDRHLSIPTATNGATIREVLQHRGGLRDYGALPAYHEALRRTPGTPWTRARCIDETLARGPLAPPGLCFAYSNPGYQLLGEVIERCGDATLSQQWRARIASPLGLTHSRFVETPADLEGLAPALTRALSADGEPVELREHYHPGWVAHRVVRGTAVELARCLDAILTSQLLCRERVEEMREAIAVPGPTPPGRAYRAPAYGLGLMSSESRHSGVGGRLLGHNGAGPGSSACILHAASAPGGPATCALLASVEDEGRLEHFVHAQLAGN